MSDGRISKFENPERIKELDPINTLIRAGFKENMILCDIGAGTGIFSFPATQISNNVIYALEKSDAMLELLQSRITERNTQNLSVKKVDSDELSVESGICDMAIMVTVLHELEKKEYMLDEIRRILKINGKLLVIEFHKRTTPMGPPVEHRISEEFTEEVCNKNGFKTLDKFSLGDNYYSIVFET